MDNLVHALIFGFVIGVLISAPMGPIGMLVIQRTLNKGRWPAFFTGIGASISDLFYCLLTGLAISSIEPFVEKNQTVLTFLGSIVLVAFGVYLFRNNPSRALRAPAPGANTFWRDMVTGFLFTVSNPLILFFIIGLFARFSFPKPEYQFYHYISGYASILAGALFWWFAITYFVNKARSHFNVRSLWLINRIIGSALIIFALVGAVSAIMDMTA